MLKELVKLANNLDSKGLHKEADYLDKIIKEAGMFDPIKGLFKSKEEKEELKAELSTLKNEYAKLPKYHMRTDEEDEKANALIEKIWKISRRLHKIAPKEEPFTDPNERGILEKAMLTYIKRFHVGNDEQKNRIKIHSLDWKFDDYSDYYWEVIVKVPNWDDPNDLSKDEDMEWAMWYGKEGEHIYSGHTVPFEIENKKYHLAGEA